MVKDDLIELDPKYDRFHFLKAKFQQVWRCLQDAGFSHRSPSYISPDGQIFDSSNQLCEYLDQFAIPEIYSNLESTIKVDTDSQGYQLRQKILQHWHRRFGNDEDSKDNDEKRDILLDVANEGAGKTVEDDPKRRQSARNNISVTVVEKGSDIYMNKLPRKGKARPVASSNPENVDLHQPSIKECQKIIENYPMGEILQREEGYKTQFRDWRFLLSTNHSLLFYGVGSKKHLLESFASEELDQEGYVLVLNGFDKACRMKKILDVLVSCFLESEPQLSSPVPLDDHPDIPVIGQPTYFRVPSTNERAIAIGRTLSKTAQESHQPIFLVINNLDGIDDADALADLLTSSRVANGVQAIRLAASIDHVDSSIHLWTVPTAAKFSWSFVPVHTYRPYVDELILLPEPQTRQTTASKIHYRQAARVVDVLSNLAPRHAEIIKILAKLQKDQEWVNYIDFRQACRKDYVVVNDSQLRSLLAEAVDHGLVTLQKQGYKEVLRIPYSPDKIDEIANLQLAKNEK